jgi:integrase
VPLDQAAFEAKLKLSRGHHIWTGTTDAGGTGQLRIDGKLRTAAQVAWEIAFGEIPEGHRIYSCPDERLCVRSEHLRLKRYGKPKPSQPVSAKRSERGSGSITAVGKGKWKIIVDAGRDEAGRRRRVSRTIRGTKTQAARAIATLTAEVAEGKVQPRRSSELTVADLVEWYVDFARNVRGLERTTVRGYQESFDTWLRDEIGHIDAERLKPAQIDDAFGRMRAAGLSHSRMNNARSGLSGAYKWGRRHEKVRANPMRGFELPKSSHVPKKTVAPEVDQLREILTAAQRIDPELAPVLIVAATTGMRRGELARLRWNRVDLANGMLRVDRSISEISGEIEDKPTKTHDTRTVSLDDATVRFLAEHRARMEIRASDTDMKLASDAFVFSIEPDCSYPMRPELMTRRMRQLRKRLAGDADFDATILAMRKWTSTELMDAGFNPSAVSTRQGHTVQVMLNNYSSRRSSADQAAADHLGAAVFGNTD